MSVPAAPRSPSGAAMLTRITQLINSVLASEVEGRPQLTEQQVVELIGESHSESPMRGQAVAEDCWAAGFAVQLHDTSAAAAVLTPAGSKCSTTSSWPLPSFNHKGCPCSNMYLHC